MPDTPTGVTCAPYGVCAWGSTSVHCWGNNDHGQIDGTRLPVTAPRQIMGLAGAKRVAAAEAHTCAIQSGKVLCWGNGATGRLGDGGTARVADAKLVALP